MRTEIRAKGPSRVQRWAVLATVSAGLLMIVLDNSILYTALPTLTRELGATGSQALWVINAYPVVMAGLLLGSGTLGDRVGHRRMFLIGLAIFGGASLVAAFAPTAGVLIGSRAVLAVGAACMMPATLALIAITFEDERERNVAFGVWGSISTVGMALGPIVGGALLEAFWWGSVFLVNVPIVVAAFLATIALAPANDPHPSKRWDLLSSVWALIGLVGAVLVIKELAHLPQDWGLIAVAATASAIGFVLFVRRQRRLSEPLLEFSIFRDPKFASGVIAASLAMFAVAGVQLITTQRYQLLEGMSPLEAGLLVAAAALGALPASLAGAAMLHRTGLRPILTGGLAIALVGSVLVALGAHGAMPLLIVGLVVLGIGTGLAMAVASIAIVGGAPPGREGMASSVEEVSYEFGSLTAVALLGSLVTFVYSVVVDLPSGVPEGARDGLPESLALADSHPGLFDAAHDAYGVAYTVTMLAIVAVLAVAVVATARTLRGDAHRQATRTGASEPGVDRASQ
ncbi:MFS transporter [Demequina sp. NBRC 110056]|uniref:MFS transporter n=1 Tax=Demequina sp. NBRC 110056 TaxID=1570345 RepID=UPI0009FCC8A8|nr:MFS transporter [Demequina sp. NBRC 110056]